jgi:hypothetical protein
MEQFLTTDTPLAAYLVQSGFQLLPIRYEQKPNGKRQATFSFTSSPELASHIDKYNRGEAVVNVALYEHTKSSLIDRLMRGLP